MKAIASLFSNLKPKELLANLLGKANEPKIISRKNNCGNAYFKVYDPQTRWKGTFSSEGEVRIWLEERYHSRF
ncbi:MAG: hypothetical protein QNJ34_06675 [Xenococcaceae cyanobacterium MO_188.B29]|nr:hypothetical protein [Xenococcaceae cyanobacterium MO_188.B29]